MKKKWKLSKKKKKKAKKSFKCMMEVNWSFGQN